MRHSGHSDKYARYSTCSHRTSSLGAGGTYPYFYKDDKEFFIKIEHKSKQLFLSTGNRSFKGKKSRAKERDYSGGEKLATSYMLHKENHSVQATFSRVLNDVSNLAQQISGGEVFQTGNSKCKASEVEASLACSRNSNEVSSGGAKKSKKESSRRQSKRNLDPIIACRSL